MKLAAEAPAWLALVFTLLLLAGAVEDAVRLRISNLTCALIIAGALVGMAVLGPELSAWKNFGVFGVLLAIGTPLFAAGKLGGGDVKLLAASGLWFDLEGGLLMVISVLLAGGVLALSILALRLVRWSESARQRVQVLRPGAGVPYGVAIAGGVLITTFLLRA